MSRRRIRSFDRSRGCSLGVERLEERRPLDASALVGLDLFRADPRFAGINGSGYAVVVIDHGADLDHAFFGPDSDQNGVADRIVFQQDFGDGDANAGEDNINGHGTSVTSILGSQDPLHRGIAPAANLIVLKLFKSGMGTADFTDLEKALQWVENHQAQYNIVAVNLSITDQENYDGPHFEPTTSDEFARLAGMGVIVVAATGNRFANGSEAGVGFPAADPNVIAVSGVWADNYGNQQFEGGTNFFTGPDHVAAFSQRHPALTDVFAPAGNIITAAIGGGTTTRRGTSFAAPYVTGAALHAQQLAERELGRRLTVAEFNQRLQSTGAVINDGDNEIDNVTNTGADYRRLNMLALGESILANPGPPVLSILDVTVDEGDNGATLADVIVQISRAPAADVTVQFATANGTATLADNDYQQAAGQLTFTPGGPLAKSIIVSIVGDTRHEPNETVRVALSNAVNANILGGQATITIVNNDQTRPWQNPLQALDVNNNGFVTGLDALVIINRLNSTGPEVLPATPPTGPYFFYDVSGDGRVTAIDALLVINYLNGQAALSVAGDDSTATGAVPNAAAEAEASHAVHAAGDGGAMVNARSAAPSAWQNYWTELAADNRPIEPAASWRRRR
jgi:hypothetical protein